MENKIVKWISITLPPFILIPLARIPPDFTTSLLWLFGGIAVLISFINVIKLIVIKYAQHKAIYPAIIRPILTISIYIICLASIKLSLMSAREFSKDTATGILYRCKANGCPAMLQNWETSAYEQQTSYKMVGGLAKYPLRYKPNDSLTSFELYLRVNIDASYIYKPDGNGEIVEVYQCC